MPSNRFPMNPVPQGAQTLGATNADWFAGLAMQALLAKEEKPKQMTLEEREKLARTAYLIAHAMIDDANKPTYWYD